MVLDLKVDVRQEKNISVVNVQGEIDIYTYPKLTEALNTVIEQGHLNFVINLENVRYIDSTGLGALADGASRVQAKSGHIYIVCNKPQVRKIFEVSGLSRKNLSLHDSVSAATDAAAQKGK